MIKFRRHVPNFVELDKMPEIQEFDFVDSMLNDEWIGGFRKIPNNFYRFSISGHYLMAEYDNGKVWWVVGYVVEGDVTSLPDWVPKK